jgi:hypothetical protein
MLFNQNGGFFNGPSNEARNSLPLGTSKIGSGGGGSLALVAMAAANVSVDRKHSEIVTLSSSPGKNLAQFNNLGDQRQVSQPK